MTPPAERSARAVFLDRDGVLTRSLVRNGRPYAPTNMDEFEILAGAIEATRALKEAGFRLVVVTNQPDVGAGRVAREVVERMHVELRAHMPLDAVKVCYHVDADGCACRKPKPGMILEAAHEWDLDRAASFMVGDRWRDIEAGQAAGCRTILVDGCDEHHASRPDAVAPDLPGAAQLIISGTIQAFPSAGTRRTPGE